MDAPGLLKKIARKGANHARIADQVIQSPELIPGVLEGLGEKQAPVKYGCEKVLRHIGGKQPALLYSYFDVFASMLDCENSFLKWGAILNIANLASVDSAEKFESVSDRYFAPIPGPEMITAANVIRGSAQIALAKPHLADRIAVEILKVESAEFKTPVCRNVAIGHAIDSFDRFFDCVTDKDRILRFVDAQLQNTRPPVRKRAEKFLKRRKA
jgi:hypothetical protein